MSAVIRLAAAVVRGVCGEDGPEAEAMRELALGARREHDAAIAERDRLRRELEALRDTDELVYFVSAGWVADRIDAILDAILRGES